MCNFVLIESKRDLASVILHTEQNIQFSLKHDCIALVLVIKQWPTKQVFCWYGKNYFQDSETK